MPTLEILRPTPHTAEVWLNRPELRNAFNEGVISELTHAFAQLGADPQLRCITLAGRGKAFCAGADLNWMKAMAGYDWEGNRADAQALADMLFTLYGCPVPIAAGYRATATPVVWAWRRCAMCWWPRRACSSA